ncbi:MAG: ACP S-malonyltransferase [Gemmatimonadales bacterium]|jgi:[acyl-carrier-protein] S-malonyltransferase|nr:ACP S-malonyltransferase [Gemmatimonadales bacterium]MBT3499920.1 ACP S-malonyltransferase [Gemmatimonadales bacterium]MBT3774285.1 ACP S-malonyltransferase [Gemmatimonadales bacterium]MBT3957881.1 ACP S-malonyltransferase [Gemmatimonadales bacterium]MBT4188463.1 ACP S-malonyltransferase [Gemmatimonadales bacterium]
MPNVAYMFPTFPMRDRDLESDSIPGYSDLLEQWTERAGDFVDVSGDLFAFSEPGRVEDLAATMNAHYACYLESLAMADWLGEHRSEADIVTGYSMGLFGALCYAGALDFGDGFRVMREVCTRVHEAVEGVSYAMGAVMGLEEARVRACLDGPVEVTDVYSPSTLIIAGPSEVVDTVLSDCTEAGAEETLLIPVTAPFHSTALSGVVSGNRDTVASVTTSDPKRVVVSAIDGKPLESAADVRREIANNVASPMSWFSTLNVLLDLGTERLYECGRSQRLTNNARRELVGDYSVENFLDYAAAT